MKTASLGRRAMARQEARFRELAGFVRYFRDERCGTREELHGMLDGMIDTVDGYRLYTLPDGSPVADDASPATRNVRGAP